PVKQKERTPLENFAQLNVLPRRVLPGMSANGLADKASLGVGALEGLEVEGTRPYVDSLLCGPATSIRLARALVCTVEDFQEPPADSVSGDLVDEIERRSTENRQLRQQNEELHRTITRIKEAVTA